MKLLSAIVFLVLLMAAGDVPMLADANECLVMLPKVSPFCAPDDCMDTCTRNYGTGSNGVCVGGLRCQCSYPC
ncbi:hypothetical protein AMTRI_Chr01g102940 [Amborella trichopoda]